MFCWCLSDCDEVRSNVQNGSVLVLDRSTGQYTAVESFA